MSSAADPPREPRRGIQYKYLTPLIYAPLLPLIRIAFRKKPVLRQRVFGLTLASALFHGFYLISGLDMDTAETKRSKK
eukprot:UC1_evm1s702